MLIEMQLKEGHFRLANETVFESYGRHTPGPILTIKCKSKIIVFTVGIISTWIVVVAVDTLINTPAITAFILP